MQTKNFVTGLLISLIGLGLMLSLPWKFRFIGLIISIIGAWSVLKNKS